jgi:hypothetical protein
MVDDPSSEHADLDLGIEQDQVDAPLRRPEREAVLGVQVARIGELQDARPATPLHPNGSEVGDSGGAEPVEALQRLRGRFEHRRQQVPAAAGRGQEMGRQQALHELHALLVGQRAAAFGFHLGAGRREAGDPLGALVDELFEAHRTGRPSVSSS